MLGRGLARHRVGRLNLATWPATKAVTLSPKGEELGSFVSQTFSTSCSAPSSVGSQACRVPMGSNP